MSKEEGIKMAFVAPGPKSEPPLKVWLLFFHFFPFSCSSAHSLTVHLLTHYTFIHSFQSNSFWSSQRRAWRARAAKSDAVFMKYS